jgi:hypothetical protein
MTVCTGPARGREPDMTVTLEPVRDLDSILLEGPVIVVEIVPSRSEKDDTAANSSSASRSRAWSTI